jgi:hypothetical protein
VHTPGKAWRCYLMWNISLIGMAPILYTFRRVPALPAISTAIKDQR